RVKNLETRCQKMHWQVSSHVAELFAQAFGAAGDLGGAIKWYDTAIDVGGNNVSFKILEQVSNIRIRHAFEEVTRLKAESEREPANAGVRRRLRTALASARAAVNDEMKVLDQLVAFQDTAERQSLRGSAMKRLAMLEASEGRTAAAERAVKAMARYYDLAQK